MRQMLCLTAVLAALLLAPGAVRPVTAAAARPAPFFLHDGDTVVFYGDSITEQLMYGRDIETFVTARFPTMHVKFINSGWSGDKVTGGGGGGIELRLKRDVLNYKPTVVTVFLGMNDGLYAPYDETAFQTYATGLTHIVDELTKALPGVRLTLLTPSFFDYNATARPAPTVPPTPWAFRNPAADYNQTLLRYAAFVQKLGAERHIPVVDVNSPLAAATAEGRKKDPKFALSPDGVHPNEVGHLLMAAAVLQAWNAPPLIEKVSLTPGKTQTITDGPLWPIPDAARVAFDVSPLPGMLDDYTVHTQNASAAHPYSLTEDGRALTEPIGATNVDLTQAPDLAENVQAQTVLALVQQRTNQWHDFWKGRQGGLVNRKDVPTDEELGKLTAEDASLDPLRKQALDAAQPQKHTLAVR